MSNLRKVLVFNLCAFALLSIQTKCSAEASNMFFDPAPIHEVLGINRFPAYESDGKWYFDVHLSPFFQHSSGARDKDGNKVAEGDRLGYFDMIDMFDLSWFADEASMSQITPKTWNATNYPVLYETYNGLAVDGIEWSGNDGSYTVTIDYEKIGMRVELDFAIAHGFGFCAKSGFVSYKQDPTFTDVSTDSISSIVTDMIMSASIRNVIIPNELGTDLQRFETTALEDTFLQIYWSRPCKFNDEKDNHVVTVYPYLSAGLWVPTGKNKDQNKFFSLPTGNDGHFGFSLEGALNFEFPGMLTLNAGAGVTFFDERTIDDFGTPTSQEQGTFYPWKTTIRRRPGTSWNFNVSMHAENIVDSLSFYADYVFTKHEPDSISVESARNPASFIPSKLEEESEWKAQTVQAGFTYAVTPNLSLGIAGQTHISGVRVYKTHTIMGTITFSF